MPCIIIVNSMKKQKKQKQSNKIEGEQMIKQPNEQQKKKNRLSLMTNPQFVLYVQEQI